MLITKQKHLGRDSFWLNTFRGTAAVEGAVRQRHATSSGRYRREEWQTRAANRKRRGGKHGLLSYVGQRVCLRGSKAIVSPAYVEDEKKPTLLLVGIMGLRLQKEANLISYKGHSDIRSGRSTGDSDDDGCCWFRAISVDLSLFAHGCVPCRGIPCRSSDLALRRRQAWWKLACRLLSLYSATSDPLRPTSTASHTR